MRWDGRVAERSFACPLFVGRMRISRPLVILGLLSGLNLVNYVDRYLLVAVGPRLQDDLHLSDTKLGLLTTAFMVGYLVTSPIFGALGDRYPRRGLIALGIAVFCLATAASGLMNDFASMFAARMLVGVGEASYATLAPTIIDDMAPPSKKNRWLATFYVAIPIGSALGYVLGGLLNHHFGWRGAFFVAGGPAALLALTVLLIAEPGRAHLHRLESAPRREKGIWLRLWRIPVYRNAVVGYTAYTFALGGFAAWAPKYLCQHLRMDLQEADFWFGVILVVTGLFATFVGGQWGDRCPGEDRPRANLRLCAVTMIIGLPFSIACLVAGSPLGFFAGIAAANFALFLSTSPINVVILQSVPAELRASAMALSIFAIHLLGDLVSPPLIGAISDASSLRAAMFILPCALAAAGFVWWRGSALPVAVQSPR
jgi:MFS transporter, Spinster family, sphingosine-1-phosphate transporter